MLIRTSDTSDDLLLLLLYFSVRLVTGTVTF
nr:MAG TPA: hypothetical protein [Caudoviricetes sp.]